MKYILTDCDGVLLNWRDAFDSWMMRRHDMFAEGDVTVYDQVDRYNIEKKDMKRYVKDFNHSANIGYLAPLYDSVKYVRKLYEEHGYQFIVVTSLSDCPYAQELRTKNLKKIFGDHVFKEFHYLDTGADKDDILFRLAAYYEGAYWLEDKTKNAIEGRDNGFKSLIIKHIYHKYEDTDGIPVCGQWKDVYRIITKNK
tara:strand:- start:3936 stop:4526 length:591 start_codon:yes stop_codon:yes gene_type:complete